MRHTDLFFAVSRTYPGAVGGRRQGLARGSPSAGNVGQKPANSIAGYACSSGEKRFFRASSSKASGSNGDPVKAGELSTDVWSSS